MWYKRTCTHFFHVSCKVFSNSNISHFGCIGRISLQRKGKYLGILKNTNKTVTSKTEPKEFWELSLNHSKEWKKIKLSNKIPRTKFLNTFLDNKVVHKYSLFKGSNSSKIDSTNKWEGIAQIHTIYSRPYKDTGKNLAAVKFRYFQCFRFHSTSIELVLILKNYHNIFLSF